MGRKEKKSGEVLHFPNKKIRKKILNREKDFRLYIVLFLRRICGISAVFLLLFTLINNYEGLTEQNLNNFLSYVTFAMSTDEESLSQIPFETAEYHNAETFGVGLAIASPNKVSLLNSGGFTYMSQYLPFKNVGMETSRDRVYLYEPSGNEIIICSPIGQLASIETTGEIIALCAQDEGFAVITDEKGYKNTVTVYNNAGEQLYIWNTSEYYVVNIALSEDLDDLAATVLKFDESIGDVKTEILLFDTDEEEVESKLTLLGVPIDLEFMGGNLCVLTNSNFYIISDDLSILQNVTYTQDEILSYDICDDRAVLALKAYGNEKSRILILAKSGDLQEYSYSDSIVDIAVFSDGVALLTNKKGALYDLDLNTIWERETLSSAKSIVLNDEGIAYAIFSGHGEIILPLKSEGENEYN